MELNTAYSYNNSSYDIRLYSLHLEVLLKHARFTSAGKCQRDGMTALHVAANGGLRSGGGAVGVGGWAEPGVRPWESQLWGLQVKESAMHKRKDWKMECKAWFFGGTCLSANEATISKYRYQIFIHNIRPHLNRIKAPHRTLVAEQALDLFGESANRRGFLAPFRLGASLRSSIHAQAGSMETVTPDWSDRAMGTSIAGR